MANTPDMLRERQELQDLSKQLQDVWLEDAHPMDLLCEIFS